MLKKTMLGLAAGGLLLATTGAHAATDRTSSISGASESLTDEETGTYLLLAVIAGVALYSILDSSDGDFDFPESP